MRKIVTLVVIFVLLVLGLLAYRQYRLGKTGDYPEREKLATPTKTLQTSSEEPVKSDEEQIRDAVAQKFNKPVVNVEMSISEKDDYHAWGSFKFTDEPTGAWFLAYRGKGGWFVVDAGNGTITCETIEPYNFPASMAPECVNTKGKLIKR